MMEKIMLTNFTAKTTLPSSEPYLVSLTYGNQRRLYSIPTDLTIDALIVSLKRVFQVQDKYGIYLYLKKTKRLLNGLVRLSELLFQSSLLTEVKKGVTNQKQGKWNQLLRSHQFRKEDIIDCRTFIQLSMAVVEFAG